MSLAATASHFCASSSVVCSTPPVTTATTEGSKYFGISSCVKDVRACVFECVAGAGRIKHAYAGAVLISCEALTNHQLDNT